MNTTLRATSYILPLAGLALAAACCIELLRRFHLHYEIPLLNQISGAYLPTMYTLAAFAILLSIMGIVFAIHHRARLRFMVSVGAIALTVSYLVALHHAKESSLLVTDDEREEADAPVAPPPDLWNDSYRRP